MGYGLDLANLDSTAKPCEDFYQFANGGWVKRNPIPAAESAWGSFNELAEKDNAVLRELLREAASSTTAPQGSSSRLVGDFYAAGMDSVAVNKAGVTPLQPELERISAVKSADALVATLADLKAKGMSGFFGVFVGQDEKMSTQYAAGVPGRTGLARSRLLPER